MVKSRAMMAPIQASGRRALPRTERSKTGQICPSVCPSDWDKRKTLVVTNCLAATYDERFKNKRRGQDSNLRTRGYPVTDLANRRFRPLSHLSGEATAPA